MMKMFAGPARAARRSFSTFPPLGQPRLSTSTSAWPFAQSYSFWPHAYATTSAPSPSSNSLRPEKGWSSEPVEGPLATSLFLRLRYRHTRLIKYRHNPFSTNKSHYSNRHIKQGVILAFLRRTSLKFPRHPFPDADENVRFGFFSFASSASSASFASVFFSALRYLPKPEGSSTWNKIARPQLR